MGKRLATLKPKNKQKNLVHICTVVSKPHESSKPQNNRQTHTQKEKQPKHNTIDGNQTTIEGNKRGGEEKDKPKTIKKMAIEIHISIITLNVNGLNVPTKRHRLAGGI